MQCLQLNLMRSTKLQIEETNFIQKIFVRDDHHQSKTYHTCTEILVMFEMWPSLTADSKQFNIIVGVVRQTSNDTPAGGQTYGEYVVYINILSSLLHS